MRMAAAKDKKARERRFLHAFVQITKLPITILAEREAPDFLVEVEGREVGLEVTEVFVGAETGRIEPKASESIIDRIVTEARRRYEERGYREGQPYVLPEVQMLDWVITHPDGTEEGNVVGKFMDTYQAEK